VHVLVGAICPMVTEFVVTAGELPKRLDIFLVNREPKLSRSALQRLIGQGRVQINEGDRQAQSQDQAWR